LDLRENAAIFERAGNSFGAGLANEASCPVGIFEGRMNLSYRSVSLSLLAVVMAAPLGWAAQSRGVGAGETGTAALNDVQRTGKRLFSQNCALCHSPAKKNNKNPADQGITIGPRLNGLFTGPKALSDAVARTFIQKGVTDKMPGFQYGLQPKEIDAIIAYLKTL
jgi:mono/diheme cytochrome c family protein